MFSQRDEEQLILPHVADIDRGIFLDIGAADGKTFSNTHALALKGWTGVCVEPNPYMLRGLLETYKDRPDITIISAAVVPTFNSKRWVDLIASNDFVSSIIPGPHIDRWRSSISFQKVVVATMPVLVLPVDTAHVINIDTEGGEIPILRQCPVDIWRTRVIIVERNGQDAEIDSYAQSAGFVVAHTTAENAILTRCDT